MTIQLLTESPYIYFKSNPITDELVNNWKILREEFFLVAKDQELASQDNQLTSVLAKKTPAYSKTNQNNTNYRGTFKSIQLYMTSSLLDDIEKANGGWTTETERINHKCLEMMPLHKSFLLKNKDIIGAFNYNISYPGSRLKHHLGLDNQYIRLHLCLVESAGCVFDIENWQHSWKEGELFGFDDGNVYHGTDHKFYYGTDNKFKNSIPRVILMIDMKKSYLEQYAKTWPVRAEKPVIKTLEALTPFKGWNN
jgi:hypothetical protein